MKKAKFLLPCAVFVAVAIILASCSKDGATGPAGPAGPAGAAGATGAAGPAGAAGSANVIYSNWTDTAVYYIDTVHNADASIDTTYFTNLTVPKIDLTMLNTGEIKVYMNLGTVADPGVFPLPYHLGGVDIDVVFFINGIEIFSNVDISGVPIRYVLIPGGTTARTAKTVDWNNYASVQKYLGLKD